MVAIFLLPTSFYVLSHVKHINEQNCNDRFAEKNKMLNFFLKQNLSYEFLGKIRL